MRPAFCYGPSSGFSAAQEQKAALACDLGLLALLPRLSLCSVLPAPSQPRGASLVTGDVAKVVPIS